ncbi:MAG: hypothetical protein PHN44_01115 [Candidatus Marinimicrobia bacterium]|nr:hypothetical protein [Candidatus Neomarinimicrobiota bacterium]MDD5539107.1 hypothetical protein [Candidatus Neomarinimicrobiota bacterium]
MPDLYKLKQNLIISNNDTPVPPAYLQDGSRYRMAGTFNSITQARLATGVWTHAFNSGSPSFIEFAAADSRQCNFTSEDFTVALWALSGSFGAAMYFIGQGVTDTDGWGFFIFMNTLSFRLNQAAGHTDISAVDAFRFGRWQLIGVTRAGNTGQFYVNGAPVTTIGGGGLVDAVSCNGGNKVLIGINDNEATNAWDGSLVGYGIIEKSLSAGEMAKMFENERRYFGV